MCQLMAMSEICRADGGSVVLVPALCIALLACGCGGGQSSGPAAARPDDSSGEAGSGPSTAEPAAAASPAQAAGAERHVDMAASGSHVELAGTDVLVVSLESNRSTGYGWSVSQCDQAVLRLDSDPTYAQGGAPGIVGAPGVEAFRFVAVAPGQTDLVLGYVRPWETGVAPVRTFVLHVTVR
jgi:inhibitor of cysteine peptidase